MCVTLQYIKSTFTANDPNPKRPGILFHKPIYPDTPPWAGLSTSAPRPPPPTQSYSDSRPTTWSLMKEALLQESNELEGHQAARVPQPQCSSAGPALGSHPPSSTTIVQASTTPFSGPIKGEVNEAWGGNYTNANRQMSHIVPSYNKQYGCLWDICIRKGGALRKPCFDCIFQWADYFFPGPPAFFRVRSVAFLCDFVSSWPSCLWGFWLMCCQLKTVVSCATFLSFVAAGFNCVCEATRWLTLALCATCILKLCCSIRLTILISKLSAFLHERL